MVLVMEIVIIQELLDLIRFYIIHLIFKFSVFAQIFLTFYSALNGNRGNAQVYKDLYFLGIISWAMSATSR